MRTSPASAGQLLTVFAVTCAISGPVIAVATGRWERRQILVAALTVTGLGNALAAVAWTMTTLIAARVVTALGTAVYTANAAAMAAQINKPEQRARAMSVVFGGLTLALLVGVPGSNALSAQLSYQAVFWVAAGLCGLGATGIALIEPMAAPATTSLRERLAATADRRVLTVLVVALLACMSTFAVYTYITALLASTAGVHGGTASVLLAGYGIGAATGNVLGGLATDRFGFRRTLLAAVGVCALLLFLLPMTASTVPGAGAVLVAWGGAFWAINPPVTTWMVSLAPAHAGTLMSLTGTAIYLGMGLGALLGGAVVAWVGLNALGPIAGVLSVAACAVLLIPSRRTPLDGNAVVDSRSDVNSSTLSHGDSQAGQAVSMT